MSLAQDRVKTGAGALDVKRPTWANEVMEQIRAGRKLDMEDNESCVLGLITGNYHGAHRAIFGVWCGEPVGSSLLISLGFEITWEERWSGKVTIAALNRAWMREARARTA